MLASELGGMIWQNSAGESKLHNNNDQQKVNYRLNSCPPTIRLNLGNGTDDTSCAD